MTHNDLIIVRLSNKIQRINTDSIDRQARRCDIMYNSINVLRVTNKHVDIMFTYK